MASATSSLPMGQQGDQIFTANSSNGCANATTSSTACSTNDSKGIEDLQCFVCDAKIQGRHYALATCRTQSSRSRVIEKLGELVGERYMVVISEDDVICRSCANLINTLDRLEGEMRNVRDNVLRFLERKYSLEEGELLGCNEKPKSSQPPQITKSYNQNTDCQAKKDVLSLRTTVKDKSKKNNVWMQCDKCRYITHQNSFMVHHARDDKKQKIFCDKCGEQFLQSEHGLHNCDLTEHLNNRDTIYNKKSEFPAKDLVMNSINVPVLEKREVQDLPIMEMDTYTEPQISDNNENVSLLRLSNADDLHFQRILAADGASGPDQPVYVRVLQPVDINEESTDAMMATSNSNSEIVVKVKENTGKQILTLTEDGNLEIPIFCPCSHPMVEEGSEDGTYSPPSYVVVHSSEVDSNVPYS